MDSFFKMEAIRGVVSALRNTCSVSVAIKKGKQQSTFAVSKWNSQRGYQVHRWNQTAWSWLEGLVYSLKRKA